MRELKKGEKGIAAQYITRTRALRKLHITLKDFRRLCILKGIFPRDPKKKKYGTDKVYYHKKDIAFLAHEPLLHKFREMKSYLKKYKKAMVKQAYARADKLKESKPQFKMDHLVRERYPSFVDALRDLDDPLTMLHLFSALPSHTTKNHSVELSTNVIRIVREFQSYVCKQSALRKVFVSIKGIYYQAEIQNQPVTWVVPHQFSQKLPRDVDFRVMITFLEFYETLLKFINFKLYNDIGLHYPPIVDKSMDDQGAGLQALRLQTIKDAEERMAFEERQKEIAASSKPSDASTQSKINDLVKDMPTSDANEMEEEDDAAEEEEQFPGVEVEEKKESEVSEGDRVKRLFKGLKILLSREVPKDSLEFVLLSAGAVVVREDDPETAAEEDKGITHQVMDRPPVASRMKQDGRIYIQPQWVYDSFNTRALLPIEPYAPGATLPPHLSPFVDDEEEGYVPKQRKVLEEWGAGNHMAAAAITNDEDDEKKSGEEESEDEDEEAQYQKELEKERGGVTFSGNKDDSDSDDDDEEVEEEEEEEESDNEEEEEAAVAKKGGAKRKKPAQTEKELAMIMMGKKDKRLYSRMQYGLKKKADANAKLAAKAKQLEEVKEPKAKKTEKKRKTKKVKKST